jgi:hypothetical protein
MPPVLASAAEVRRIEAAAAAMNSWLLMDETLSLLKARARYWNRDGLTFRRRQSTCDVSPRDRPAHPVAMGRQPFRIGRATFG